MIKFFPFIFVYIVLVACNPIPNKSVFEELTTDEVTSIIKKEPDFSEVYKNIRSFVELTSFSEAQKTQYKDVTYRKLYKYTKHVNDEKYWYIREEKWKNEWNETFSKTLDKVDEKVAYWTDYKEKNSLSRFVKVELSEFYINHYSYHSFISGVDDVYICFNITPLEEVIEQLKFTYSYSYKINNGRGKKSCNCICKTPITNTKEYAWEIPYSEKDDFYGMTVSEFLHDYDLIIEITDVRKDGVNYSLDDLDIPEAISNFWKENTVEARDAVAVFIDPSYISKKQFLENKKNEELKEYDSLCYDFLER